MHFHHDQQKRKAKTKEIMDGLKKKAAQEFENSLPMSRDNFKKLFDYLDITLSDNDCDDTNGLTRKFLFQLDVENVDIVLQWLADQGGYCDCEISENVQESFE